MLEKSVAEPHIACPRCNHRIPLTESIAAPLLEAERQIHRRELEAKEIDYRRRIDDVRRREEELAHARASVEDEVARRLQDASDRIRIEELKKARQETADELSTVKSQLAEMQGTLARYDVKLADAQREHAEVLRMRRDLDDQKRELELTVEKRVNAGQAEIHVKARREAEDELKAQVSQKDAQIESMGRTIEELKRKAVQGSQQTQGEALELELETLLKANFPLDRIEPVARGEVGGDICQRVNGQMGASAGTILWELKSTKNWNDGWLVKLREDQRSAKADIALIVSQALPREVETFGLVDGVWIAHPRYAVPVAIALRHTLVELASLRGALAGRQTKTEQIYEYLIGPRFRQRIEGVMEKFEELKSDLDKERKFMNRIWAKRESQIQGVIESTACMYGDLQGIAGSALPEIPQLDVPLLDAPDAELG